MADDWPPEGAPALPPGLPPAVLITGSAQVTTDEIQRQRQAKLQAAADQYAYDQKLTLIARRQWQNQREQSHLNLMGQVPKLIGASCFAALLAYIIPLGDDR